MCQSPQEAHDVSWGRCALNFHSVNNSAKSAKVDDLEGLKVQSIEFIQVSDSWRVSGARKKLKFNCVIQARKLVNLTEWSIFRESIAVGMKMIV